jgi:DNA-directed RNA polymerase subunit M/transcription elongation factor TFIIS
MSVFGAAKERVRATVPGLTTKAEKQRQAMEDLAEIQGVPVGQFRCEECGTQKGISRLGGWAITKTPEGEPTTLVRCKSCSVKWDTDGS